MDDKKENEEMEIVADEDSDNGDILGKLKRKKEDLKKCLEEKKEYLDGWQRTKADHINYKKEEGKRFEDMARFVTSGLIQDILPVLDSFDLAIGHDLPSGVEKGVLLIRSQFMDILKKRGLEVMNTDGQKFNPAYHEGLGEVESDQEEGMIVVEIQKGYLLRGQVLRPARVKISVKK